MVRKELGVTKEDSWEGMTRAGVVPGGMDGEVGRGVQ